MCQPSDLYIHTYIHTYIHIALMGLWQFTHVFLCTLCKHTYQLGPMRVWSKRVGADEPLFPAFLFLGLFASFPLRTCMYVCMYVHVKFSLGYTYTRAYVFTYVHVRIHAYIHGRLAPFLLGYSHHLTSVYALCIFVRDIYIYIYIYIWAIRIISPASMLYVFLCVYVRINKYCAHAYMHTCTHSHVVALQGPTDQ
jgi:hypothetical protein